MPTFSALDGTTLYYTDAGDGPAILCLAGLTRNGTDFDYVAPHLAEYRLIRMDYRGRGRSDWADPATYTIAQEAQDALALLDHLGLASVAILGTSRGGLIGMGIAAMARDRLTGLAMNDIGPEIAGSGLSAIGAYLGRNPAEKTFADAASMRAHLMEGFQAVPEARWQEEVRKHYVQTPDGLMINYDPRLRDVFEASRDQPLPDLWPWFDALTGLPVAVIRGQNSDLLSAETVLRMRARNPDLITAEVAGRGHVPFLDEPEALSALETWTSRLI
ncbi:MAG: alpha/beta hydrolase [Pseudomonadota bacterium]